MGKSILGILTVIVLQIAFVIYLTLNAPADETVGAIDISSGEDNHYLSVFNDLEYFAPSSDSAAVAIHPPPSSRSTKVRAAKIADLPTIRRPATPVRRLYARAISNQPRALHALHLAPDTYVRKQFFGRWVVETTYYGFSNHQAKNFSKTKKRSNLA